MQQRMSRRSMRVYDVQTALDGIRQTARGRPGAKFTTLMHHIYQVERLRAEGRPTLPVTMGAEKAANPFLRPSDGAIRERLGMEKATDAEVFAEIRKRKDNF